MESKSRKELHKAIQEINFVLYDLVLYLDTHPDCPCALATYQDYKRDYDKMVEIYERKFGPLFSYSVMNEDMWTWTEGSWPWQKECDC